MLGVDRWAHLHVLHAHRRDALLISLTYTTASTRSENASVEVEYPSGEMGGFDVRVLKTRRTCFLVVEVARVLDVGNYLYANPRFT
jgi:hypothetical protein